MNDKEILLKLKKDFSDDLEKAIKYVKRKKYSRYKVLLFLDQGILERGMSLSEKIFMFINENIPDEPNVNYFNSAINLISEFYAPFYIEKYIDKNYCDVAVEWFTDVNSILLSYIKELKTSNEGFGVFKGLVAYYSDERVHDKTFERLIVELSLGGIFHSLYTLGYIKNGESLEYITDLFYNKDNKISLEESEKLCNDFFIYLEKKQFPLSSLPEVLLDRITDLNSKYILEHIIDYPDESILLLIKAIPEHMAAEVIRLIVDIETKKREEITLVEEKYSKEFYDEISKYTGNLSSLPAEVISGFDVIRFASKLCKSRLDETSIIFQNLQWTADPVMCEIKKGFFKFEDIENLDDRDIQKILREVDTSDLAIALKDAAAGIREAVFRNVSNRSAELLREDINFIGKMHKTRITQSRNNIENVGNKLLESKDIVL